MSEELTRSARKFASHGKSAVLENPLTALAHINGLCVLIENRNTRPAPDAELVERIRQRLIPMEHEAKVCGNPDCSHCTNMRLLQDCLAALTHQGESNE